MKYEIMFIVRPNLEEAATKGAGFDFMKQVFDDFVSNEEEYLDPVNTKFANYVNSREFDEVIKGDVSPEGLCFVPASDSKTGKGYDPDVFFGP